MVAIPRWTSITARGRPRTCTPDGIDHFDVSATCAQLLVSYPRIFLTSIGDYNLERFSRTLRIFLPSSRVSGRGRSKSGITHTSSGFILFILSIMPSSFTMLWRRFNPSTKKISFQYAQVSSRRICKRSKVPDSLVSSIWSMCALAFWR